jgi:hypothetical protein
MGATDYEVVNQQHPLIRFIAHKSRPEDYHQLVALTLDKSHLVNAESGVYILLIQRWSTRGAKDSESLVYRSVKFDSGELMGDEFSERLTLSSIAYGQEWLNAQTAIDSKKAVGQFNQLEILLDQEFDEHCESMTMENNDRIDLAISTLEGQEEKLITEAEERIQTLRERGGSKRERMIPLQEGRIKSIRATTARRIAEYDLLRQSSKHEPSNVILAVVKMK